MSDGLVTIPVSVGELIDKITILEIKLDRISDPQKLRNIRFELERLREARARLPKGVSLAEAEARLAHVNRELWDVEDALRAHEAARDFGPRFVELARSVYRLNDRRAAIKHALNQHLNSPIIEEKSYRGER